MKLICTFLSFFILALSPILANAAPLTYKEAEAYEVTVGSQALRLIEAAVESIFQSPMKDTLCHVYGNYISLSSSVGITAQTAHRLMSTCPQKSNHNLLSKLFSKRYFLIFSEEPPRDVESWTTEENHTYLWVHPNFSFLELRDLIAHEMAMAVDGKMGMMLTTYYTYEKLHVQSQSESMILISVPSKLDPVEERLREAFHGTSYRPIGYALASMRAFQFEKYVNGSMAVTQVPSHPECVAQFKRLYEFILNRPKEFSDNPDSIQGTLAQVIEKNVSHEKILQTIRDIGDSGFTLPASHHMTFCQYMARPLLSGKSLHSFFANGPRPRTTGGWKEGEGSMDGTRPNQTKGKYGTVYDLTNNPQDRMLIEDLKSDLRANRLRKLEQIKK